jgi:hypothetical protein
MLEKKLAQTLGIIDQDAESLEFALREVNKL